MAPHSSTLAWKIPWTEEPGRLQSVGSQRVGHDWATSLTFHFHALKEMATHSSILAWRIPGTGETGGLPSMGSHRVGHNWSDLAAAAAAGSSIKRLCKEISGRIFLYQFCMSYYFCIHWTSVWNSLSFCMYFLLFVQIMTWDKWWGTKASLILLTL